MPSNFRLPNVVNVGEPGAETKRDRRSNSSQYVRGTANPMGRSTRGNTCIGKDGAAKKIERGRHPFAERPGAVRQKQSEARYHEAQHGQGGEADPERGHQKRPMDGL